MKKWFQYKEESAGENRLLLTWQIYKIFGEFPVRIIAFFVGTITFLSAKDRRFAAEKYFQKLYLFTKNKKFKNPLFSTFKLFLNFSNSLVDKMILFSNNFNQKNIEYSQEKEWMEVLNSLKTGNGAFFISTHLGNIEIMRTLLHSKKYGLVPKVNIFLQKSACEIFNNFLKKIQCKTEVEVFAVEDIDITTSMVISEKLKNGEIVFMAGDRISAQSETSSYETLLLGEKVRFPLGTLKFAQMLNCPIFFAICAKEKNKYIVHTEKFDLNGTKKSSLEKLKSTYTEFLQKYTLLYPYQFYNFYDLFQEK
jgi:predicted LPLAT superfamily acyltransferase